MSAMPSSEFRKRFARLTERTLVTANGRPIGVWTPVEVTWRAEPAEVAIGQPREPLRVVKPARKRGPVAHEASPPAAGLMGSQAERDKVLRRMARG